MVEGDCLPIPVPASCFLLPQPLPQAWGGYLPPTQHPIPVFIPVPVPMPIRTPFSSLYLFPFFPCPHHDSHAHSSPHPQCCPHSHPNSHSHPYPCPHSCFCAHSPHSQPVLSLSWPCCMAVPEAPGSSRMPRLSLCQLRALTICPPPACRLTPPPRGQGSLFLLPQPGDASEHQGGCPQESHDARRELGNAGCRDAWTRFSGPSEPAWGPAHCHPPQGACKDLRTCSALWVMPQYRSVPQHPGCLRCRHPLPGWQASTAVCCSGGSIPAFYNPVEAPQLPAPCQPACPPACCLHCLPACCLPACPGMAGEGVAGPGAAGPVRPAQLHSLSPAIKQTPPSPPPPGPLPAARRCLTLCCPAPRPAAAARSICPSLPAAGLTPSSDLRVACAPRAGWAARVVTQVPRVPAAWHHPGQPRCGQHRRAGAGKGKGMQGLGVTGREL